MDSVEIEIERKRAHAVCIPLPIQGHINAMLRLAKLLHSRGFRITFVHTESNYDRLADSSVGCGDDKLVDGFQFETMPGDLQFHRSPIHSPLWAPTRSLLHRLNKPTGSVPPPTCIVYDVCMSFVVELSAEIGVPNVCLCPVSGCSFMGFFHYKELVDRGIVPLKNESDLETNIDWIPGMNDIPLRLLRNYMGATDATDILWNLYKDESQAALCATAIVVHTFEDLERPVLDALSSILPPVYSIGPLNLLTDQISDDKLRSIGLSLWKEDSNCIDWLDRKAPSSVVYVNFGSATTVTGEQLTEFAWGIACSGHDFLWVIRPGLVKGGSVSSILTAEFLAETSGRGLVTSWCVQEEVLRHPSVGGFFTHCGWNSTMEAVGAGVPMVCWPVLADQPMNCRYLCDEWGMGLEIGAKVERHDVKEKIRELMGGGKGKAARKNAAKWKESAYRAAEAGGKSSLSLELIKEVMLL